MLRLVIRKHSDQKCDCGSGIECKIDLVGFLWPKCVFNLQVGDTD